MLLSKQVYMLNTHAFDARVLRVGVQRKLSIAQPAAQRFGIDPQTMSRLSQRHNSHERTPFDGSQNTDQRQLGIFSGVFLGRCWTNRREWSQEFSWESDMGEGDLAHFLTTTTVVVASPILMRATEEGPVQKQWNRRGSCKDQVGKQVLDFGDAQGDESR